MCKNSELISCVSLQQWVLVYTVRNRQQAEDLATNMARVGQSVGLGVAPPTYVELQDDRKASFVDGIKQKLTEQTQCIVCILPSPQKDRYDAIKKLCSVEFSIPSQCVVARCVVCLACVLLSCALSHLSVLALLFATFSLLYHLGFLCLLYVLLFFFCVGAHMSRSLSKPKTIMSVCNKIALQINCKLGGELWRLDIPLTKTMLVGIDVCHDTSPSARVGGGRQSVAGFCASMNQSFTKYYSRVSFQRTGQELVDGLKVCMTEALRSFFEINHVLPDVIIVYRDGVGDGMLEAVVCGREYERERGERERGSDLCNF